MQRDFWLFVKFHILFNIKTFLMVIAFSFKIILFIPKVVYFRYNSQFSTVKHLLMKASHILIMAKLVQLKVRESKSE